MTVQQAVLSLVLATMVFSIALDLRLADFRRVLETPRAVLSGLLSQFLLLPVVTWAAMRLLDLPPHVEAALLLIACAPGGSLSSVLTHIGRGNTALSLSISASVGVLSLVLTPFNFTWTMASNPATADWMRTLAIDPLSIWWSLLGLLGVPMAVGLLLGARLPALADRLKKPLARFSFAALFVFIAFALVRDRHLLTPQILPEFGLVVLHNAAGLALGWIAAHAFALGERERRAVTIEGGMQNAGFVLGIVALQFASDVGMVVVASLWGMWCIVSGLALAYWWRRRSGPEPSAQARLRASPSGTAAASSTSGHKPKRDAQAT
jgi:BASS family bile acid:Na+ symporter